MENNLAPISVVVQRASLFNYLDKAQGEYFEDYVLNDHCLDRSVRGLDTKTCKFLLELTFNALKERSKICFVEDFGAFCDLSFTRRDMKQCARKLIDKKFLSPIENVEGGNLVNIWIPHPLLKLFWEEFDRDLVWQTADEVLG